MKRYDSTKDYHWITDRCGIHATGWDLGWAWNPAQEAPGDEIVVLEDPEYTAARNRRLARLQRRHEKDLAWIKDNKSRILWLLRDGDEDDRDYQVWVDEEERPNATTD